MDIGELLAAGRLRKALRLSVALPDICTALENPWLRTSRGHYVSWCDIWLSSERVWARGAALTGDGLYGLRLRHGDSSVSESVPVSALIELCRRGRRRRSAPASPRSAARRESRPQLVDACEALVDAARRWYRHKGRWDPVARQNLARLCAQPIVRPGMAGRLRPFLA